MEDRDIALRVEGVKFTLRAAALIFDNDRLLMVKDREHDSCYTVGGRVRAGESSADAAAREALEETGCRFEAERLLFVQERFFRYRGNEHHEVAFYYLMRGNAAGIAEGRNTDRMNERLCWLAPEDLGRTRLVPEFLMESLRVLPDAPVHIITRER